MTMLYAAATGNGSVTHLARTPNSPAKPAVCGRTVWSGGTPAPLSGLPPRVCRTCERLALAEADAARQPLVVREVYVP